MAFGMASFFDLMCNNNNNNHNDYYYYYYYHYYYDYYHYYYCYYHHRHCKAIDPTCASVLVVHTVFMKVARATPAAMALLAWAPAYCDPP